MLTKTVFYLDYDVLRDWLIDTFLSTDQDKQKYQSLCSFTVNDGPSYMRGESKWIECFSCSDFKHLFHHTST